MRFIEDFTAVIGEAPLWSPEHDALFWIDTWQQKIMRARQPFHRSEVRDLPYRPACLARLPGRKLLVAYKEAGLASFDFDAGTSEELPLAGLAFERAIFNDGACDANGRLWIGTRDREATDPIGALYRIGSDLRPVRMVSGLTVSNGVAFSPDGLGFYHTESRPGRIDVYAFDMAAGTLAERRVLIDYAGRGARIARYRESGQLDRVISLPLRRPSSLCFGGPGLNMLFVTSMSYEIPAAELAATPHSGHVAMIDVEIGSIEEPAFRL